MESARSCCQPRLRPSLRSIFLSFIRLCAKKWHRNKTAYSDSNPVQSSRSVSTTCPRKGRLLRFESNSAATSERGAQKPGNDVRHNSESITTKICSQISRKCNAMFESHLVTSVDRTSFDFLFEDFFEQSSFVNIHLLCYWPTIHNSISKICPCQFSLFRGQWAAQWALSKNCAKWKYFNSNLCRMR